jgi:hypothetical protein
MRSGSRISQKTRNPLAVKGLYLIKYFGFFCGGPSICDLHNGTATAKLRKSNHVTMPCAEPGAPSIQIDEKFDIGVVAQLFYVRLSRPLEFGCRYPVPHGGAVFVEE